jgi:hypothetical protein
MFRTAPLAGRYAGQRFAPVAVIDGVSASRAAADWSVDQHSPVIAVSYVTVHPPLTVIAVVILFPVLVPTIPPLGRIVNGAEDVECSFVVGPLCFRWASHRVLSLACYRDPVSSSPTSTSRA